MTSPTQKTRLLAVLVIVSGLSAAVAYSWEDRQRNAALTSHRDLADCRQYLAEMPQSTGAGAANDPLLPADSDLNGRLHAAAAVAGVPDHLASIEPGQPRALRDTTFSETPIFVRLNAVSLRQLVTFLHQLSSADWQLRTTSIELSIPQEPPAPPAEGAVAEDAWSADLTLASISVTSQTHSTPNRSAEVIP